MSVGCALRSARRATLLLGLIATPALAAEPLPAAEAGVWLQRISDASRRIPYEGVFVFQHGNAARTLSVANRPTATSAQTRLLTLDGQQWEVRCTEQASVTVMHNGNQIRSEKRLNNRHFPDLLPEQAAALVNWYHVRMAGTDRVAGRECSRVELVPKDAYRWGYELCVERHSGFPLRAVLVDDEGRALQRYSFAELRLGALPKTASQPMPAAPDTTRPLAAERVLVTALPPGFTRVAAVRRQLPRLSGEVEHWVFTDGLTYVSLFIEPATRPVETVRGQSRQGMTHMVKRQVGEFQATVLGDAPLVTVQHIAAGLSPR